MTTDPKQTKPGVSRRSFLAAGGVAAAGAALAACSSSTSPGGSTGAATAGSTVPSSSMSSALAKPTTLTFWTWVPNIAREVAMFEKAYPHIKVNVVNAGQGLAEYTKLRTALQAGSGAPDVVQIEYSYLPTFTITNDLVDLAPYGAADIAKDYVPWTWKQVSVGSKVFAIPQDTGPLGMLYRKDIFDEYGLSIPETWDDFATQGKKLRAKTAKVSMLNFANNDAGQTFGYAWQAGARPFKVDGSQITLGLNSADMMKLANYYTPLVESGVVSADADFVNDWYAGLTNGSYATWVTAAWAPIFLQSSAAKSSGKWRVAPIPQWGSGAAVSGNWGGSTSAVTKQTKLPEAAAALAIFINHNSASSMTLATKQSLYPPLLSTLHNPAFSNQKSAFFGGQQVNKLFAQISATVSTDFQWSPFNDYITSTNNQILGSALQQKKSLADALNSWQTTVVAYAKKQGFQVAGS